MIDTRPARRSGPESQATQEKARSGTEPLACRRAIANSSPQCRRLRRNSGERSSTGDSAWESREVPHAEGHHVAGWQPRQDGLSTRWHLRDRRGCIPSCRCRLRGRRRSARTMHARRRERRGASRLADETIGDHQCQRDHSEVPLTTRPGVCVAEPRQDAELLPIITIHPGCRIARLSLGSNKKGAEAPRQKSRPSAVEITASIE